MSFVKSLWFKIVCVVAAGVLLVGCIVFFNVFYKDKSHDVPVSAAGEAVADFTLPYIGRDGSYTLSEHIGKVIVINFWGTWCGPCIAELPDFERAAEEYDGRVEFLAIHSAGTGSKADPAEFIANEGWSDWKITFLRDSGNIVGADASSGDIYARFGGTAYPVTVILDENGVIFLVLNSSVEYDELTLFISVLLDDESGEE